jgi:hypothetical protein
MKPNYWLLVISVLLIVLDDCLSMLGLRKLANLLYGNLLERLKKHEPMRTKVIMVVFNAWANSSDPMLGAS